MFSRRSSRRLSAMSAALLFVALFFLTATDGPQRLFAQSQTQPLQLTAGRNVNMVAGTKWPDGDPYLQRQNEPSIAGSTRNPLHLLAGANDYRTVDVPFVDGAEETGDAWLGIFKSYDGGARWRTTLLPGYPQDPSAQGQASPLHGYDAGADPVVRAGTNGLFYYAGLVFDRVENGRSAIFVARFIDNNNQEDTYRNNRDHVAGDPITYLGTQIVAANGGTRFLDKPWMAVDIPRDGRTCSVPAPGGGTQQVPAGFVYVAYSSIYEDKQGIRSDILLSRSTDCGATWSAPARVSDPRDRINQGATLAIDPGTGTVHVAWRRFASGAGTAQTDGIMTARSTDRGSRFSAPGITRAFLRGQGRKIGLDPERYFEHRRKSRARVKPEVAEPAELAGAVDEFDQSTSDIDGFLMFRTNAYPTMAIDGTGRVYVAWAERGFTSSPGNEARIVMSTSTDGRNWTTPNPVANEGPFGHQLMPSLTYGGGRLVLVYYDLREDVSGQFASLIDDKRAIAYSQKRHTMDLRASEGSPGATPAFKPSVRVSDYLVSFAQTPDGTLVEQQGQFNPPNLPMFKQGTAPFMGDYVDVAVSPAFVPTSNGRWAFNTAGALPVFHAVWTDNRDVRQPKQSDDTDGDGNPWNNYTPPSARNATGSATSVFDPTMIVPQCDPQKTGSRNQNIYTARLSMGLVVGSPGNTKPLSPTVQRAFVVFAQNTSSSTKAFRFSIVSQPTGGRASFRQFDVSPTGDPLGPLTTLVVTTPPRSTAARSVYATSSNPAAQILVDVVEVPYGGTTPAVPLADRIILNPDIANPDIANPDIANPDIANPDIANAEVYNPDIANPDIANPDIANPDIANPDIANPDIANPDIANPDIANPDIANPDIANPDIANKTVSNPDIANPDIANPDIANPDIANPDIANPDIANPDIANGSLSDVTWTMTNNGNTTAAFNVNLFLAQQTNKICPPGVDPSTGCIATQLILRKVYTTPVANGCEVGLQSQNVLLASIKNPQFVLPGQALPDQNNSDPTNATLWLAPGESAKITLRVYDPVKVGNVPVPDGDTSTPTPGGSFIDPVFLPTTETTFGSITPVVQQQAVDTQDVQKAAETPNAQPPTPPVVTPLSPPVPSGEQADPDPTPLSLAFDQQPTAVQVGSAFSATVVVRDQYGALLPNAEVTLFVGASPNPPGTTVVLSGATATSDANGVATFPALSIAPPAIGYTLVATAGQALPAVSNTFVVTAIPITVTLGNLTQSYTGSALAPSYATMPIAGLPVALAYSQNEAAAFPVNAGSYDVSATITHPNYQGSAVDTFIINKATPAISWTTPAAIVQGTVLSGTQLNATATLGAATVPGSFVYTPAVGTPMNASGSQTLSVTFTPTDAANYDMATASVTIDVTGSTPIGSAVLRAFVPGTAGGTVSTWPNAGGTPPVNTGLYLNSGNAVTVTASGAVSWYNAGAAPPAGALGCQGAFIAPCPIPGISLIARIGSGPWQFVGAGPTTLTADMPGVLEFAVNDNGFIDNGGGWDVEITVTSAGVPGTSGGTVNANQPGTGGTAPVVVATVAPGDQITVSAAGAYSNGLATYGAAGNGAANPAFVTLLAPALPPLSLVARIAGGSWQYIGPGPTTLTAWSVGTVELAVNDDDFGDNSGALQVQVSVVQEAIALPPTVATAAAGGSGGSPFGRYYCPAGEYAVGLKVATNGTPQNDAFGYINYAVTTAEVVCSGGSTTPKFGGGTFPNSSLMCGPGEAMVGIYGTTSGGVLGSLGARCQPLNGGPITQTAQLPSGGTPFGPIDCTTGAVLAVQGRQGAVLDQLQVLCGDTGFIDLGTPTLAGGAISVPGLSGQAISFSPPAGSPNQYALFADQPRLVMTNAVTISAWINPTGPGFFSSSFSSPNDPTPMGEGGMILNKENSYEVARFADGSIRWAFWSAVPGWTWINSFAVAPANQWTHVAVTYDAGASVALTYLNGVLAYAYPVSGPIANPGGQLRIGGRQNTDGNSVYQNFQGVIDGVQLFNRALTAAEVQALAGQYSPGGRP